MKILIQIKLGAFPLALPFAMSGYQLQTLSSWDDLYLFTSKWPFINPNNLPLLGVIVAFAATAILPVVLRRYF